MLGEDVVRWWKAQLWSALSVSVLVDRLHSCTNTAASLPTHSKPCSLSKSIRSRLQAANTAQQAKALCGTTCAPSMAVYAAIAKGGQPLCILLVIAHGRQYSPNAAGEISPQADCAAKRSTRHSLQCRPLRLCSPTGTVSPSTLSDNMCGCAGQQMTVSHWHTANVLNTCKFGSLLLNMLSNCCPLSWPSLDQPVCCAIQTTPFRLSSGMVRSCSRGHPA